MDGTLSLNTTRVYCDVRRERRGRGPSWRPSAQPPFLLTFAPLSQAKRCIDDTTTCGHTACGGAFGNDDALRVMVRVSDGDLHLDTLVTVHLVQPTGRAPPSLKESNCSVPESALEGDEVCTLIATVHDGANGTIPRFSLEATGATSEFRVDEMTGVLLVGSGAVLDYESRPRLSIILGVAEDLPAPLRTVATVEIAVVDVNEPPETSPVTLMTVPEDSAPGHEVGCIAAKDPEGNSIRFFAPSENQSIPISLSADGCVRLGDNGRLDFEDASMRALEIDFQVSDDKGKVGEWSRVRVDVTDVDDAIVTAVKVRESDGATGLRTEGTGDLVVEGRDLGRVDGTDS